MEKIQIETVLNGWKVKCGCQEVVFTDLDKLCSELKAYLADPPTVRKRYLEDSVNAKWSNTPQVADGGQCETQAPNVRERDDGRILRGPATQSLRG